MYKTVVKRVMNVLLMIIGKRKQKYKEIVVVERSVWD